jgi:hypothetical protein
MKLDWDPEIDTPATVAVLGAGPVGVEAALYARFLGYYVVLIDARRVGSRLIRWGNQSLNVKFGEATSSLGLAALEAQEQSDGLPAADEVVTCREYVEKYLLPLAKSDLIQECVHINSPVVSISRAHWPKGYPQSIEERSEDEFRILMDSRIRGEFTQSVDVVIDCTGDGRLPAGIGPGGGQAIGQLANRDHCLLGVRDMFDKDRDKFLGKRTILFGCSPAACYNAVQFAELAKDRDDTLLTWVISRGTTHERWLSKVAETLPDLAIEASKLLKGDSNVVVHLDAWGAESMQRADSGIWQLRLLVGEEETVDTQCDVVLLTEYSSAWDIADGLHVERCSKRGIAVAASNWLEDNPEGELVVDMSSFITTEPNYYVLGRKSVAGDRRFSFHHARQQIQQVFGLIGGRKELDLYQTVKPSLNQ